MKQVLKRDKVKTGDEKKNRKSNMNDLREQKLTEIQNKFEIHLHLSYFQVIRNYWW